MRLKGQLIDPKKTYKVAGWAPVAEGAKGEPIWEVVETWLKTKKRVSPRRLNLPRLIGLKNNPGMAG
jgi:sulfur-oxidizing protein SoxB